MITKTAAKLTVPVDEAYDHIRGAAKAPVTLLEYGDYECPYCGQAYWFVKELEESVGDMMRFAFRNFPLTSIHPHAENVAEAAEAAGAQDKFWEVHDCLFEHQETLDDIYLIEYADMIGLDVPRVTRELAEHVYAERVRQDFLSGVRSGVNGTPTFFINGVRYDGSYNVDSWLAAIEQIAGQETERISK